MRWALLLFPFYRLGEVDKERLSNLSNETQAEVVELGLEYKPI